MELSERNRIQRAVGALTGTNWISFADLQKASGLSRDELIRNKQEIEQRLKAEDPDVFLTSRVDLEPAGFEVNY